MEAAFIAVGYFMTTADSSTNTNNSFWTRVLKIYLTRRIAIVVALPEHLGCLEAETDVA